jgi:hypothetical protein
MEEAVREVPIEEIAAQIKTAHALAEEGARSSLTHAFRAGELLHQAKKRVPHGAWLSWLAQECHVKTRSAQGYMALYKNYGTNATRVAHLPLREILRLLAKASARPPGKNKGKRRPATSETAKAADGIAIQLGREDIGLFWDLCTAGYKTLAMKMHPDTGGDGARMQALNALHKVIEKQLVAATPHEAAAA